MATTTTKLMTFAEFAQLPDTPQGFPYDLRHGELVTVVFPRMKHFVIQQQLRRLLESAAGKIGIASTELGFRALAEYEYRRADVAFVLRDRWESCDPNGYFLGAPEIVIEVLSPSNTATEMLDKEKLCLENGCKEFWIVDPDLRLVKVSTPDGHAITYCSGQEIALFFGGRLAVDTIFAPLEG